MDRKTLEMEVDMGAAVSVISEQKLKEVLSRAVVKRHWWPWTYTPEKVPMCGEVQVTPQYGSQSKRLTLYVIRGEGPCLLGQEWLCSIRLDWKTIGLTTAASGVKASLETVLNRYSEVFRDELGTVRPIQAKLKLKEDVMPKFYRPHLVPFALKEEVERELKRLEQKGILKKVKHCEWATPIVPVPKKDGQVRVCGDYKVQHSDWATPIFPFPKRMVS